jgi:D-alanyl-D-alanine carboxypeptidase/D-alanyl-D-alanine-endopeptidase (penicillin-binding protein 4)
MVLRSVRMTAAVLTLLFGLGTAVASARTAPHRRSTPALGISPRVTRSRAITSTAGLARSLSADLRDAGGSSSALVVDEDTGRVLFSDTPTIPRLPASVEKLFTTSAALFDFGSNHRFETAVYGVGRLSHGVFSGQLYLKGGGDPSFGDSHFNATHYGTGANVQTLVRSLRAAGVRTIRGSIIGDASIFDADGGGPDTGYRANLETEGELSGLSYDAGFTSGAETRLQPQPALWAAQAFATVAAANGISVAKGTKVSTGKTPAGAALLAKIASPTVATLLKLTNAPSDNFFAETLDKDLGAYVGSAVGTTADGAAVVKRTIATKLGLSERTDDGSGLSNYDRTTATEVVELLEEMQPSLAFYNSLAVAGRSGTMIDEMLGTPAANNCRGKTGTLHNVANLVGYCVAANGQRLVFAFLENRLNDATYGHLTEDLMGEALADYDANGAGAAAAALPEPDAGAGVPTQVTSVSSGPGPEAPTTTTPTATTTPTSSTTTTTTPSGQGGAGL